MNHCLFVRRDDQHRPGILTRYPELTGLIGSFADRAGDSFPEIASTGANAVRFMWVTGVPA